jgi:hypothetical protein
VDKRNDPETFDRMLSPDRLYKTELRIYPAEKSHDHDPHRRPSVDPLGNIELTVAYPAIAIPTFIF